MWYNKLHAAKAQKKHHIQVKKSQFVRRMAIHRLGYVGGMNWYNKSSWGVYADMPALEHIPTCDEKYANLLRGNPYVGAEAARRHEAGVEYEMGVRAFMVALHPFQPIVLDQVEEAVRRIRYNDPVFENAVNDVFDC